MIDEELIARLRKFGQLWPDDAVAADRIEALVKERDEALEWLSASQGYIADAVFALDKQEKAEAERDALRAERDASNELGRAFEEDAGQQRDRAEAAEAQIAALTARVEGLTGALDKARTQDRDPDYVYDEEWEYTMRWDEWPDLVDGHDLTEPMPIYTLYKGPTKWVVQIPIDTDGDGETDDFETKLFDSEETARAALSATTEASHE